MSNVLLVEDDPSLRQVLELLLGQLGCQVNSEADALAAIMRLKTHAPPPDLLLTDLCLPGMDGYELLRTVRQSYPKLPVVFITGFQRENLQQPQDRQPDAILQKPIRMEELRQVLEQFVV